MTAASPVPEGFHTVTPYVVVDDVAALIDFLTAAFDAVETLPRRTDERGRIQHTEVRIGDSMLMLGQRPEGSETSPGMFYLYVDDCDALYARALAAGATSLQAPVDQPYGDRLAGVADRWGCHWFVAKMLENKRAST